MIRFALMQDKPIIKKMWEEIFPEDGQTYIDFYFGNVFKPQYCLVIEEDNQIVSSLQMNPHQLSVGGHVLNVSYIVGVCTLAEYRNQGYMHELMNAALAMLRKKEKIVLIQAYQPELYYRFGFEDAYDKAHYLIASPILEQFQTTMKVDLLDETYTDALVRLYADFTTKKDGYALRDNHYYERMLDSLKAEDGRLLGCFQGADLVGYIVFKQDKGMIYASEVIYRNEEALLTLIKVMSNKSSMIQVSLDLSNPIENKVKYKKKIVKPYLMVKLLDPEGLSLWMGRAIEKPSDLFISEAFINEEI